MKRIAMLAAFTLGIAGCGGVDDNSPSVAQVTATVQRGGGPATGVYVQESTAVVSSEDLGTILDAQLTDASGQATFTVPSSTSTGQLCFSSYISWTGGESFRSSCKTLNALTRTIVLDHDSE